MGIRVMFLALTILSMPFSLVASGICLVGYLTIGYYQLKHNL